MQSTTARGRILVLISIALWGVLATAARAQVANEVPDEVPTFEPVKYPGEIVVESPLAGQNTILSILPEGTKVKKGTTVCELDAAPFRERLESQSIATQRAVADVENARKSLEVARLAMKEYEEGIYKLECQAADGDIELAKLELAIAQAELKQTLEGGKNVDDVTRRRLELAVARAQIALERAIAQAGVLRQYSYPQRIKRLKGDIDKATTLLTNRQGVLSLEQKREANLRSQIKACTLVAPADGVVVLVNTIDKPNLIEPGALVREKQAIFKIVDPSKLNDDLAKP